MERLEQIKGYLDRVPKEDARWLVGEVTRLREDLAYAREDAAQQKSLAKKLQRLLSEARGEAKPPRCPCGFPDDHAGWCPRR